MNPEPQILNLASPTEAATATPDNPADALLHFERRGNGTVARLPKAIRDQLNQMLLNGVPYLEIIQRLGDHGHDLKPAHLGEWKKRGFRDWLIRQDALDFVQNPDDDPDADQSLPANPAKSNQLKPETKGG